MRFVGSYYIDRQRTVLVFSQVSFLTELTLPFFTVCVSTLASSLLPVVIINS
jgi:hypothetical protein